MTTAHFTGRARATSRQRVGRRARVGLLLPLCSMFVVASAAVAFIAYVLWPRWPKPPVAEGAPALPITVAGATFIVPPAAIRMPVQRHAGTHERIDLAFLWPSLEPPGPNGRPASSPPDAPASPMQALERVFVTIAAAGDTLPPAERVKTIYSRYAADTPLPGPPGLAVLPFRDDSPYQGEDLIYDAQVPANFLVRCSRNGAGPTLGICLFERRIEGADVVVRFPRDWLDDWSSVASAVERLITRLRPAAG